MSRRSRTKSPGSAENLQNSDEHRRHGVDGILANLGKRIEWLDIQLSALAKEVLKAVKTVGIVQDFARSTEARVTALESVVGAQHNYLESNPSGTGTDWNDRSRTAMLGLAGIPASPQHAPNITLASGVNNTSAPDNRDVLRGLETRLKESFNELHRWQSAVEGVVQQAVTEGCKDQSADVKLHYHDGPHHATDRLADISPPDPKAIGKSTEATLAQLEDDIAKLRMELKGGQVGQNNAPNPVLKEFSGEQLWPGSHASKPEQFLRSYMPRSSSSVEIDVEAWKADIWRSSPLSRRENGEISRLYDQLLRLEEEEKELRKPVPGTADHQAHLRRRSSSTSNLASRKTRTR
jgi:hypothetical protein